MTQEAIITLLKGQAEIRSNVIPIKQLARMTGYSPRGAEDILRRLRGGQRLRLYRRPGAA
jgi:hypothetical protein